MKRERNALQRSESGKVDDVAVGFAEAANRKLLEGWFTGREDQVVKSFEEKESE